VGEAGTAGDVDAALGGAAGGVAAAGVSCGLLLGATGAVAPPQAASPEHSAKVERAVTVR
jgi:hypothetical protein